MARRRVGEFRRPAIPVRFQNGPESVRHWQKDRRPQGIGAPGKSPGLVRRPACIKGCRRGSSRGWVEMANKWPGGALREFQTLFCGGTPSAMTDQQLLERVAAQRDPEAEAAFG